MTVVLGPTWAYEERDKLVSFSGVGRYFTPDTVGAFQWASRPPTGDPFPMERIWVTNR